MKRAVYLYLIIVGLLLQMSGNSLLVSIAMIFSWSCQSDRLEEISPSSESGISLNGISSLGGVGNNHVLIRKCASHEVMERDLAQNSSFARNLEAIEAHTRAFISSENRSTDKPGNDVAPPFPYVGSISIPVIVNIIYNTPEENISDEQIASQIQVLNEDFSKTNPDVGGVPEEFAGVVADIDIRFTLAKVNRKSSDKAAWGTRDDMKFSKNGGIDVEDPARYLNIWVCNIGGGVLGYAQFPGGRPATDGVVVGPLFFGNTGYLYPPYDKGRTATHEVGHWLNLRHIWGDGPCGKDDFVADTPASDRYNIGCPVYPTVHCQSTDMTMNYMDYSDDACMFMFSNGQKGRMRALFARGGFRESIVK
jgi:hypothetical protein